MFDKTNPKMVGYSGSQESIVSFKLSDDGQTVVISTGAHNMTGQEITLKATDLQIATNGIAQAINEKQRAAQQEAQKAQQV